GGHVRLIAIGFDGGVIHEIQLEIASAPFATELLESAAELILRAGIGGVEDVERVFAGFYKSDLNRFAVGVMKQPVLVVLVNPGFGTDAEWRYPHAELEAQAAQTVAERVETIGPARSVGGHEFTIVVGIAFVDVEVVVAKVFQILGKPLGVGGCVSLREAKVIGGPTPPSPGRRGRDARIVQETNGFSVSLELRMVIVAH